MRIILKTATSETDAERGTIFLKDPDSDELVSQILEGGSVNPIRLPIGTGIAGTAAQTGQVVNTVDAYQDPRFDKRTDASSGFKTVSILAAPMRTPAGEIVGVVEILNKRRRNFTREDEEFLAEVATHAAIAVAGLREHEAAVRQARREGAAAVARGVMPLLLPAAWPETPGFESAPLRWRSETPNLAIYAVSAAPGRLALLLLEHPGDIEDAIGPLVRASALGHRLLEASAPADLVRAVGAAEPACAVTAARWEADHVRLAAREAPVPHLLRFGRPVPFEVHESEGAARGRPRDREGRHARDRVERPLRPRVDRKARFAREGRPAPRPLGRDADALGRLRGPRLGVEEDGILAGLPRRAASGREEAVAQAVIPRSAATRNPYSTRDHAHRVRDLAALGMTGE